jgi:hypothetical protein
MSRFSVILLSDRILDGKRIGGGLCQSKKCIVLSPDAEVEDAGACLIAYEDKHQCFAMLLDSPDEKDAWLRALRHSLAKRREVIAGELVGGRG